MLLGVNGKLENIIIEILAKKGELTAQDILSSTKATGRKVSLQAVYLALSKLREEGVIVKHGQHLSIRIPWLLELASLSEQMESTFLRTEYIEKLVHLEPGEKRVWKFTNLFKMNDFWSQVLLALAHASEEKVLYDYSPELWVHLLQPAQELQYQKTLTSIVQAEYMIIGNTSSLDRRTVRRHLQMPGIETHLMEDPPIAPKDVVLHINVVDDCVVTMKLDKDTDSSIKQLYAKNNDGVVSSEKALELFHKKVNVKLKLEHNPKKALTYKKKFQKIFGIRGIR